MALVDPATQKYPALHAPLHDDDPTPLTAPYVPAGHSAVHNGTDRPVVSPYRPALQLVQTPAPPTLNLPVPQMAALPLVDPGTQAYPALQLPVHAADGRPAVAPYEPAGQRLHAPAPPALY